MPIKVTNKDLFSSMIAMQRLGALKTDSIKGIFLIGKARRIYNTALADFDAARQTLVMQCAAKHEDDSVVYLDAEGKELPTGSPPSQHVKIADLAAMNDGIVKLFEVAVSLDMDPISLDAIGTPVAGSEITGDDLATLSWLIV